MKSISSLPSPLSVSSLFFSLSSAPTLTDQSPMYKWLDMLLWSDKWVYFKNTHSEVVKCRHFVSCMMGCILYTGECHVDIAKRHYISDQAVIIIFTIALLSGIPLHILHNEKWHSWCMCPFSHHGQQYTLLGHILNSCLATKQEFKWVERCTW